MTAVSILLYTDLTLLPLSTSSKSDRVAAYLYVLTSEVLNNHCCEGHSNHCRGPYTEGERYLYQSCSKYVHL